LANATLVIEVPSGPFSRGEVIELSLSLRETTFATRIPIAISSTAFAESYTVFLKSGETKRLSFVTIGASAPENQDCPITATSSDPQHTVAISPQPCNLRLQAPVARFQSKPRVSGQTVTVTVALDRATKIDQTWALVQGECLGDNETTWSTRDNGHIVKFDKGAATVTLTLPLKQGGYKDSKLSLTGKANCGTASSGATVDLGLVAKPLPKVAFPAAAITGARVDPQAQTGPFRVGAATITAELDQNAPEEGATAEIASDFFTGGPFRIEFPAGQKQSRPCSVRLQDTGKAEQSFTLRAISGCVLTENKAKAILKLAVQAPRLRFATKPVKAEEVPEKKGKYKIGGATLCCAASYCLDDSKPAGSLTGACFAEKDPFLLFTGETAAEAEVELIDTGGEAATVTIRPADGYVLDPDGKTSIDLEVEAPTVTFADNQPEAEKVPSKTTCKTGAAKFSCKLNYKIEQEATAAIRSDFLAGKEAKVVFAPQADTVTVTAALLDTGGKKESFTLEPLENCRVDDDKKECLCEAEAPRVKFAEKPITADEVPDKAGVYKIGSGKISCTATYKLADTDSPATIVGACFREEEPKLTFTSATAAEASVTLIDTNGEEKEVSLLPKLGYVVDPEGETELQVQVEPPTVTFADNQPDGEHVSGNSGPYKVGAAKFSCRLNYGLDKAVKAVLKSAFCEEREALVTFQASSLDSEPVTVTLLDTKGAKKPFTLFVRENCRVDDEKKECLCEIAAPRVKFSADQPKGKHVSGGETGPYLAGPATFTCQLNYAASQGARAKIKSDYLEEEAIGVAFSAGKTESDSARGTLKDTAEQEKTFSLEVVSGCMLDTEDVVLSRIVKNPVAEGTSGPVQHCSKHTATAALTVQVENVDSKNRPEFVADVLVSLTPPAGTEPKKTAGSTGIAKFDEIKPDTYTVQCTLEGKLQERFFDPPERKVIVHEGEKVLLVIGLRECHWLDIRLVNLWGEGVAGEPYIVGFPDGTTTDEKKLDDNGEASHKTPAGDCIVKFPSWYDHDFVPEEKIGTFVEIELRDAGGMPVPDEPYKITLPDNTTIEGKLDKDGRARHPSPKGECTVEFPNWYEHDFWIGEVAEKEQQKAKN